MNDENLNSRLFDLCSDDEFMKRFWNFIDSQGEITPERAKELYKNLLENIKVSVQLAKDYESDEFTRQARYIALTIAAGLGANIEEMSFQHGAMPDGD